MAADYPENYSPGDGFRSMFLLIKNLLCFKKRSKFQHVPEHIILQFGDPIVVHYIVCKCGTMLAFNSSMQNPKTCSSCGNVYTALWKKSYPILQILTRRIYTEIDRFDLI